MNKNSILRTIVWKAIKWNTVTFRVRRIQRRIYKASKVGNTKLVHKLQNLLIRSIDAKLFAVHTVTTLNKGKNTAWVDGERKLTSDTEKLKLARKVCLDGQASPIRRVWIPKPGKTEKRPLGIPTMLDRAKQALAKLALEPQWEAQFEKNSYGFRPGRSAQDAIEAIFLALRKKQDTQVKWVFDADIRKCFDKINHEFLLNKLNTFPQMKNQVKAWLEADIMEGYANNPKDITASTMGTPQGGGISPLLANIALHGLENRLKEYVSNLTLNVPDTGRDRANRSKALQVIRYADDFLIIHKDRHVLCKCIQETKKFLSEVGLEVSEEKSRITKGNQGFLFLGFSIIQVKKNGVYKVKVIPSKASQMKLLDKVKTVLEKSKAASSYDLIQTLRPTILGWANYFKYCECSDVFHKLTHKIFLKLRAWVFRRDTRNGRMAIKQKYFPSGMTYTFDGKTHKDNWILVGKKKVNDVVRENSLPHIVWVSSKKHVKVVGEKSPYDGDHIYWAKRSRKYRI
jgi:RNA-directed DNA polymerase